MEVLTVSLEDDLAQLVADINAASWDEANEMCAYDVPGLRDYLQRQDNVFIACYESSAAGRSLLGIASARLQLKPYGNELWLYVDEVDVCEDQRRRGAGKLMMSALRDFAQTRGCEEMWLGTEVENDSANALYKSLDPDDVAQFIGYTYETDQ